MRIGIITGEYPPLEGGVGAYTRILAHRYADLKHNVFIYADHRAEESRDDIQMDNVAKSWGRGRIKKIKHWATQHALDVINLQFETAAFNMSPWVHFLPGFLPKNIPLVTTFHDLLVPYLFPKAGPLRQWIVRRLATKSDGVIVTNQEDFRQLSDLRQTMLIPIGSNITFADDDAADHAHYRQQAGASNDDFLIVFFGFLNRSKGVELLLEDAAYLIKAGYPIKIVMLGGRTGSSDPANVAYADEIDTLIDALGIAEAITQTGFIEDAEVSGYLRTGDAVALPYRDGASYRRGTLMAAIQHGCPIITTRPQVNIPLFRDGHNMLIARRHVINEACPPFLHITPEILKLYRNPDLAHTLKQGARLLADEFDWDTITRDTLDYFKIIIEDHKRR